MQLSCQKHEFLGVAAIFGSDVMLRLLARAEKIASTNATVLINGESGTGKEVIARAIHHHSPRSSKSWIDVNCAALPEHLLESELFGFEKGAFSGANNSKPGLFEMADGGTLFLDEIGDLDLRMQAKLLRVLDGAGYFRLGGIRKVMVDVRLITATNQDLKLAAHEGRFRSDLYHRLSQIRLAIPPLRERADDVIPLAQHFLAGQNPALRLSPEVMEKFRSYQWFGNVRELRNVVIHAALFATGPMIEVADLPEEFMDESFSAGLHKLATIPELEKDAILSALKESSGHQERAAAKLGISRRTLQRRMRSYVSTATGLG
jgi:transcriptional regulator with PAS, ATPase and Fis domain